MIANKRLVRDFPWFKATYAATSNFKGDPLDTWLSKTKDVISVRRAAAFFSIRMHKKELLLEGDSATGTLFLYELFRVCAGQELETAAPDFEAQLALVLNTLKIFGARECAGVKEMLKRELDSIANIAQFSTRDLYWICQIVFLNWSAPERVRTYVPQPEYEEFITERLAGWRAGLNHLSHAQLNERLVSEFNSRLRAEYPWFLGKFMGCWYYEPTRCMKTTWEIGGQRLTIDRDDDLFYIRVDRQEVLDTETFIRDMYKLCTGQDLSAAAADFEGRMAKVLALFDLLGQGRPLLRPDDLRDLAATELGELCGISDVERALYAFKNLPHWDMLRRLYLNAFFSSDVEVLRHAIDMYRPGFKGDIVRGILKERTCFDLNWKEFIAHAKSQSQTSLIRLFFTTLKEAAGIKHYLDAYLGYYSLEYFGDGNLKFKFHDYFSLISDQPDPTGRIAAHSLAILKFLNTKVHVNQDIMLILEERVREIKYNKYFTLRLTQLGAGRGARDVIPMICKYF